ncbi:MAG: cytochrome C assembly protein [Candidatus Lokiarchaeota archaeon]|nr:cytochrome C assembly protein [Candidatus Lokiarchaeota archaeon]
MNYKITKSQYFLILSLLLLVINLFLIFGLTTFSRIVYIIFFYHVSAAWLSYFSFGVSLICHILYLKQKKMNWSILGKNSIVVGVFFVGFTLITGSLWFNATSGAYNNIYWQWSDPRQTTTLILFLSYVAYLIFRNFIEDQEKKAKLSAILGIVFFPTVPLSYLSAIIFTSLHPIINPNPGESGFIYWDSIKLLSLFLNLIAITLLFIYLVRELKELDLAKLNLQQLIQAKMEEGK